MSRSSLLLLAVCLIQLTTRANAEDLQDRLNAAYDNKIYVLRHPIEKENQHYGPDGQPVSAGKEGPWTIYGAIQIKRVSVTATQLRLQGERLIYSYDEKSKDLRPHAIKWDRSKVSIEIDLAHAISTPDEAASVLHGFFVFDETELLDVVPEYWRPFLRKQLLAAASGNALPTRDGEKRPVDKKMPRPEVLRAPSPDFNPVALQFHAKGTVVLDILVTETGEVAQPTIYRPVGFGLDEQAISDVKKWKFKPAVRDGQPIAMHMAIELAFNE